MIMKEKIEEAVYSAIEAVNLQRLPNQRIKAAPDAVLVGAEGLDSLGLVNFVVILEEKLAGATGQEVSLISDGMDFQGGGCFSSVGGLCEHVLSLVES